MSGLRSALRNLADPGKRMNRGKYASSLFVGITAIAALWNV
jgi:hypothetical protein